MAQLQYYEVYIARYNLAVQDPDTPGKRYHTGIFVQTGPDKSGTFHQVTGDVTSESGMHYTPEQMESPEEPQTLHSLEKLGVTPAETHPDQWESVLRGVPPPPQQKQFNIKTMKTEPFKTKTPLAFYEPGEVRTPLIKCTEWTLERAIPALRASGLIIQQ